MKSFLLSLERTSRMRGFWIIALLWLYFTSVLLFIGSDPILRLIYDASGIDLAVVVLSFLPIALLFAPPFADDARRFIRFAIAVPTSMVLIVLLLSIVDSDTPLNFMLFAWVAPVYSPSAAYNGLVGTGRMHVFESPVRVQLAYWGFLLALFFPLTFLQRAIPPGVRRALSFIAIAYAVVILRGCAVSGIQF